MALQGISKEKAAEIRRGNPNGHVVIGDEPVYVGLYKQSTVTLWYQDQQLPLVDFAVELDAKYIGEYDGRKYIDTFAITDDPQNKNPGPVIFELPDGHELQVKWVVEDNYYVYARLQMPSGDIWHGWSGYGVGAGLEDAGYGYDTGERFDSLIRIWPEDFNSGSGG